MAEHLTQASYLLAAVLFILSLRWLNHPSTARRGVAAGVAGMAAAIAGTLLHSRDRRLYSGSSSRWWSARRLACRCRRCR